MTHRFSGQGKFDDLKALGPFPAEPLVGARQPECEQVDDGRPSGLRRRLAVYEPQNYEPNYAYPLIVWLPGSGGTDREVLQLMPYISTRNYFGLSLPGFLGQPPDWPPMRWLGFADSSNEIDVIELAQHVGDAVCQVRREYHIHSERVMLAGFDEGATAALRLMLWRPEWFAGAVGFNARFPRMRYPLSRFRDLRGKRVLLGTGIRDSRMFRAESLRTSRLLHLAGMDVSTRSYDAGYEITEPMLADVDHWIMAGIDTAV